MDQKTCKNCSQTKPVSEFYKQIQRGANGKAWRYFDSYCKICRIQYSSERRRKVKRECVRYLGGKCVDCGLETDRVEVYDFHHRDPNEKDFGIGRHPSLTFDRCKPEIEKCDLLCANCHRLRHKEE